MADFCPRQKSATLSVSMDLQSIKEKAGAIKGQASTVGGEWLTVLIVMLVGLIGFGMGHLSALEASRPAVSISQTQARAGEPMLLGGLLVGSRHGAKYHYPWCPGAQQMNDENKIWFASEQEARQYGYTPAGNCAGLTKTD